MDKKEAAIGALNLGIPAIITSGSILTCAGYIVYHVSSVAAIADLGHLIGRGALISMIFVCSMMPAFLVLFDHILMQNEFERILLFLKKRRERRHARLKRLAQRISRVVWKEKKPNKDSGRADASEQNALDINSKNGKNSSTRKKKSHLLKKIRDRRKQLKSKMKEKREAKSHEKDH